MKKKSERYMDESLLRWYGHDEREFIGARDFSDKEATRIICNGTILYVKARIRMGILISQHKSVWCPR